MRSKAGNWGSRGRAVCCCTALRAPAKRSPSTCVLGLKLYSALYLTNFGQQVTSNHAVQAVAAEFGAAVHTVTAGSVFGAYTGESERRLREAFEQAATPSHEGSAAADADPHGPPPAPTVLFLDELDALCPRRDSRRPHESRVVAQLLTLLDGSASGAAESALPALGMSRFEPVGCPSAASWLLHVISAKDTVSSRLQPRFTTSKAPAPWAHMPLACKCRAAHRGGRRHQPSECH